MRIQYIEDHSGKAIPMEYHDKANKAFTEIHRILREVRPIIDEMVWTEINLAWNQQTEYKIIVKDKVR